MADFILVRKSRNILSSITHVALNILLGVGSIVVTVLTGSWVLGVLLVFLSKWRMFAVRPRYWLLNLKSNIVDLVVGISFVLLAYIAGGEWLLAHWLLAALYTVWLVLIKPRSETIWVEVQALMAVFFGIAAASLLAAPYDSILTVLPAFLIGYGASRHIISQSGEEKDFRLITFLAGLFTAEVAWLCHSWYIIYQIEGTGIVVPQAAIILTLFAFLFGRIYHSISRHDGKLKLADIAAPLAFVLLVIFVMIIKFSDPLFEI